MAKDKASKKLTCQVLTPGRTVFDGQVDMLVVTAVDGELGILPRHAPMVGALATGEARIKEGDRTEKFAIFGGLVEVLNNKATVLASGAVPASEVDVSAVRAELQELENTEPETPADKPDLQRRIARAKAQLLVAEGRPEAPHE